LGRYAGTLEYALQTKAHAAFINNAGPLFLLAQMLALSSTQNRSIPTLSNKEQTVQVCDATTAATGTPAGKQKQCFLNYKQ